MNSQIKDDSRDLQPAMVGNPMLAQVRDFIDAEDTPPALDPIGIVVRALRGRERRVATMILLVAFSAATLAYLVIQPVYQSSGMLRVLPREGKILYSDSDDSRLRLYDAFVTTEMQLLTSRPVLESALHHMQSDYDNSYPLPEDVGDMAAMVTVTGKKGLISLAGRSGDPRLSAATVNSVIAAYEHSNESARRRQYDVRREELWSREGELEQGLANLNSQYLAIGGEHDAGTLSKAHVAKTAQLEVLEERIAELDNTIAQLQLTGGVGADVGNNIEIQRSTLLDQAMAEMTYERAQRLAALETLRGRYRPSHPKLRSAQGELLILEGAIAERREQIAMLGKAGALTGSGAGSEEESLADLQLVRDKLIARRKAVRSEAADLNNKLIRIRGVATEKERLEELLVETKRALDEVLVESQNDLSRAIEIVALGKVPDGPIEDKRKPLALGAAVFGGLGTLAMVLAGNLLAGVVRFSDDLDERSRDILGAVIKQETPPDIPFLEAARKIRNELDLRSPQAESQALVLSVVGTGDEAGVTGIAQAIGKHYSNGGRRVLLIDADADGNGLSRLYQADVTQGTGAVARGATTLQDSVRKVGEGENALWLLPSPCRENMAQSERHISDIAVDEMKELLGSACAEYDVVILDLGHLKPGGQSTVGAAMADRTVLVTTSGELRRKISEAQNLLDRLASHRYVLAFNRALSIDPVFATATSEQESAFSWGQDRLKKLLSI